MLRRHPFWGLGFPRGPYARAGPLAAHSNAHLLVPTLPAPLRPACPPPGASIIWQRNYLVRDLAAAGGLALEPLPQGDGLLAVYDGRELVFAESPW